MLFFLDEGKTTMYHYIGYENEGMIVAFSIQVIALRLDIKISYLTLIFKIWKSRFYGNVNINR